MNIFFTIAGIVILVFCLYISGLILVWLCEIRRNFLYRQMRQCIRLAENLQVSRAVLYIKTYKINRDYYQKIDKIERLQHFILKKMSLAKRSSLKNMAMQQNGQEMETCLIGLVLVQGQICAKMELLNLSIISLVFAYGKTKKGATRKRR